MTFYKGIKWSKETLKKRADALRGKKRTIEQRRKMSLAKVNFKPTHEAILKGIETRRKNGWNKDPELTHRKQSENNAHAMLGRKMTVESRLKKSIAIMGEKNHNWRGGLTNTNDKIRRSLEYKLWRESVFKRDNFTCLFCGQHGGALCADHIKPFALFPELRFAIDNGRTLCKNCHLKTDTFGWWTTKIVLK